MGWDGTWTSYYKNGKVDVKRFCDEEYTWAGEKSRNEVIKSSMVGSTYYAAVRCREYDDVEKTVLKSDRVFAIVVLTSTRRQDGCNILTKGITEFSGPCEHKCPMGILKLLTPLAADEEWAKAWRIKCYEYHANKKKEKTDPYSLKNLPEGSQIKFTVNFSTTSGLRPGDQVVLTKNSRLKYAHKNGEWVETKKTYWSDGYYRWKDSMIPKDFVVISVPAGKEESAA